MDLIQVKSSDSKVSENGDFLKRGHIEIQNCVINSKSGNGKSIHGNYVQEGSPIIVKEKALLSSVESRLSPRVKQGIELKILKTGINGVKPQTPSTLQTRSPLKSSWGKSGSLVSGQDSDSSSSTLESLRSGTTISDSGKNVAEKKARIY